MYQPQPPRALSAASSLAIVALLGAGLVLGFGVPRVVQRQELPLLTVAMADLPKPPPPPPPPVEKQKLKKSAAKDEPSPRNIRNQATQIVAPPVVQPIKPPPPVVVAPVAGVGNAANNGASNRAGPGQGAGGIGNGLGGGGNGGDGDDDDDWETPPREISTNSTLSRNDLPPGFFDNDSPGISLEIQFTVLVNGSVANCHVTHSSGYPNIDAQICRKAEQRFRLRPALDADGRPVRSEMAKELYFGPPRR